MEAIIITLATIRLTRFITTDTLFEKVAKRHLRAAVGVESDDPYQYHTWPTWRPKTYLLALLDCPWCIGFWLSAAAVTVWLTAQAQGNLHIAAIAAAPFALSQIVGWANNA